jgi:hypothetical protein
MPAQVEEKSAQIIEDILKQWIPLAEPISPLFRGFNIDRLLEANSRSDDFLFKMLAQLALEKAAHRARKMQMTELVLPSDFILPIGDIARSVAGPSALRSTIPLEFPADADVIKIIRECCPWC